MRLRRSPRARRTRALTLAAVIACGSALASPAPTVVLLHGLARSASSMAPMAKALEAEGFRVCNIGYPSRKHSIAALAADHVAPALAACAPDPTPLHFVTHSLGGIIVRQLAATGSIQHFGRVVMLSPPNQGSEVVDAMGEWTLFRSVNGPAGSELGTTAAAMPHSLGPAPFELGVITGNRSINLVLSTMIPGTDDGKVSVANAQLAGMADFVIIPSAHPFIMKNSEAIRQTIHFLHHGKFQHGAPASPPR